VEKKVLISALFFPIFDKSYGTMTFGARMMRFRAQNKGFFGMILAVKA